MSLNLFIRFPPFLVHTF